MGWRTVCSMSGLHGERAQAVPAPVLRHALRLAFRTGKFAKAALQSNKTCSTLLYDLANVEGFSDLASHERMLADAVRMDSYAAAIRRFIKPGDVVVDLGTGVWRLTPQRSDTSTTPLPARTSTSALSGSLQSAEEVSVSCGRISL